MNIKKALLYFLALYISQANVTWGGPIYITTKMLPSNLKSPLGTPKAKSEFISYFACVNVFDGQYGDCAYDIQIKGLVQPSSDVVNNGGHPHDGTHPLGEMQVIHPTTSAMSKTLSGQTRNGYVYVSHLMPEASGKIEVQSSLHVPRGWVTVYPESCYGDYASWCFHTTLDVGIKSELYMLANNPAAAYIKVREPMGHPDDVAYYGTIHTLFYLNNIARSYKKIGYTLSVNDMSLSRGGLFDVNANYAEPHKAHRTGNSADINHFNGASSDDCLESMDLLDVVDAEMPIQTGSIFAGRLFPSRFLCETWLNNNIHIDFDGMLF